MTNRRVKARATSRRVEAEKIDDVVRVYTGTVAISNKKVGELGR